MLRTITLTFCRNWHDLFWFFESNPFQTQHVKILIFLFSNWKEIDQIQYPRWTSKWVCFRRSSRFYILRSFFESAKSAESKPMCLSSLLISCDWFLRAIIFVWAFDVNSRFSKTTATVMTLNKFALSKRRFRGADELIEFLWAITIIGLNHSFTLVYYPRRTDNSKNQSWIGRRAQTTCCICLQIVGIFRSTLIR